MWQVMGLAARAAGALFCGLMLAMICVLTMALVGAPIVFNVPPPTGPKLGVVGGVLVAGLVGGLTANLFRFLGPFRPLVVCSAAGTWTLVWWLTIRGELFGRVMESPLSVVGFVLLTAIGLGPASVVLLSPARRSIELDD